MSLYRDTPEQMRVQGGGPTVSWGRLRILSSVWRVGSVRKIEIRKKGSEWEVFMLRWLNQIAGTVVGILKWLRVMKVSLMPYI